MKEQEFALTSNRLVRYLKKPPAEFSRNDIITFIEENGIRMLNFRYVSGDGKLQ